MEKVSALIDGELDEHEAGQVLAAVERQEALRDRWDMFHLIGDTLRDDCRVSPRFSQRIAERLATEPTVLAPRRGSARRINTYVLSAAASISAVALVAWVALSSQPFGSPQEVAQVRIPPVASVPATPQVARFSSHGNVNEYLLAHQGFSPSTAIQGVVPYIRSVSDSQPLPNR